MIARLAQFASLALLGTLLGGCDRPLPQPFVPPVVEVQGVRQAFALRPGAAGTQRLVAALRDFAEGRMDALHVALPPGPAGDRLAWHLHLAGVLPRKIARDGLLAPGTAVATRYLATVAPCPTLDFSGAALGDNPTRPGFGCATLATFAAQAADPADLLGNNAAIAPDSERAATPVARWRGFGGGGGGAPASAGGAGAGAGGTTTAAH